MDREYQSSQIDREFFQLSAADRLRLIDEALADDRWMESAVRMRRSIIHCTNAFLCAAVVILAARHLVSVFFLSFLAIQVVLVLGLLFQVHRLYNWSASLYSQTSRSLSNLRSAIEAEDQHDVT